MLSVMENPQTLPDASFLLQAGEGTTVPTRDSSMWIKVRGEDTGGAFAIIEAVIPAHTGGPPLHINTREDELFYILDGALLFQLGERRVKATAGALCYAPKRSVHTFANPYDAPARMLGMITPAGFERYFEEMAPHLAGGGPPASGQQVAEDR